MEKHKLWAYVGVGVIVLVAIGAAMVGRKPATEGPTGPGSSESVVPPVPVTYAPKGEITPEFPKELILDASASANVAESYAINYSSTTNQYTVKWNSSSSMATLLGKYKDYFATNHWTVTNSSTQVATIRAIAASTSSGTALAVIVAQGKGSQVTLTYTPKQ